MCATKPELRACCPFANSAPAFDNGQVQSGARRPSRECALRTATEGFPKKYMCGSPILRKPRLTKSAARHSTTLQEHLIWNHFVGFNRCCKRSVTRVSSPNKDA